MVIIITIINSFSRSMNNLIGVLGTEIKLFISIVFVLGPFSIAALILLLKKIEKTNPDRIRWH